MQIRQIYLTIKTRRANGEYYSSIADDLGINKALVKYIEMHPNYKPSKHIAAILFPKATKELTPFQVARDRMAAETKQSAKGWKTNEHN